MFYILSKQYKVKAQNIKELHDKIQRLTQMQQFEHFVSFSDKQSGERVKQVMEHIWKFQEFCNSMTRLEIDSYEYAYLKAIVLFSPGDKLIYSINIQMCFFAIVKKE